MQTAQATTATVAGTTLDVVIVASGASGGWAAKRLSEAGLQVCLLEAGRALTDADDKHEVGTARMGANPKTSFLNQYQQAHAVPNLLVTDGAGFPSIACQNPTLPIMALTVCSCDHLLEQVRAGNLQAGA